LPREHHIRSFLKVQFDSLRRGVPPVLHQTRTRPLHLRHAL
jgi:hypothetical protein